MKKLLAAVAVTALFVATPALADGKAASEGGLLPYGLGLTLDNDVSYAIDAGTFTAEPSATVDWNNVYLGVTPTVLVDKFKLTGIELEAGYHMEMFNVGLTPYVKMTTDGEADYQDTSIGFTTSVKF
jgi:hypothetical protein